MKISHPQKQQSSKGNFPKYLPPSNLIQPKAYRNKAENSNIHCRSMQELDLNLNMNLHSSIPKENSKPNIHHSSLFNQNSKGEQQSGKSKSLSKFISFFQNSNLLKTNQPKKEVNETKRKNYNGFCYDLKISGNSTVNNKQIIKKKDKENINYQTLNSQRQSNILNPNRSPLLTKNQKVSIYSESGNQNYETLFQKMKDIIQQKQRRETKYSEKIESLESKNKELQRQVQRFQNQIQGLNKKSHENEQKIRELETKNKEFLQINRNSVKKEQKVVNKSSRQQDMVIKSLKKVINQQLNKIIELERVKIQNQYLREKLGIQEDQSFSGQSFSNQDYSFQYENEKQNKKSSSSSSSSSMSKSDQIQNNDYGRVTFKKSNQIKEQCLESEKGKCNGNHFKSFFQVQESSISADANLMNLFKPSQSKRSQQKKAPNKSNQKDQGTNMIKIAQGESSFSRQAIEEVNEENYQHQISQLGEDLSSENMNQNSGSGFREQYSILEQVDQYLTKWRNQA